MKILISILIVFILTGCSIRVKHSNEVKIEIKKETNHNPKK
jgi:outer membrane biogenesis lipoprotein LolB